MVKKMIIKYKFEEWDKILYKLYCNIYTIYKLNIYIKCTFKKNPFNRRH